MIVWNFHSLRTRAFTHEAQRYYDRSYYLSRLFLDHQLPESARPNRNFKDCLSLPASFCISSDALALIATTNR